MRATHQDGDPNLTPAALIARAEALRPLLLEQQDEAEVRGYYSEQVHQEFLRAGFSRILQPRRFGGYEFDVPTFFKVMVEISRATLGADGAYVSARATSFRWRPIILNRHKKRFLDRTATFERPTEPHPTARRLRSRGATWSTGHGITARVSPMPPTLWARRWSPRRGKSLRQGR